MPNPTPGWQPIEHTPPVVADFRPIEYEPYVLPTAPVVSVAPKSVPSKES